MDVILLNIYEYIILLIKGSLTGIAFCIILEIQILIYLEIYRLKSTFV